MSADLLIELHYRLIITKDGSKTWIRTKSTTDQFKAIRKCDPVPVEKRTHDHENLDIMLCTDSSNCEHIFLGKWKGGAKLPYRERGLFDINT